MVKTIGNVEGEGFITTTGVMIDDGIGLLGEIRQIALSITGALTKSQLQARGWAICDGTTPATQGISDPVITTTPDLREKFLRHSADETTGGTGGEDTHILSINEMPSHSHTLRLRLTDYSGGGTIPELTKLGDGHASSSSDDFTGAILNTGSGDAHENKPPYYDICYFIKVK